MAFILTSLILWRLGLNWCESACKSFKAAENKTYATCKSRKEAFVWPKLVRIRLEKRKNCRYVLSRNYRFCKCCQKCNHWCIKPLHCPCRSLERDITNRQKFKHHLIKRITKPIQTVIILENCTIYYNLF